MDAVGRIAEVPPRCRVNILISLEVGAQAASLRSCLVA
jgi:hypothetical protein